MGQMTQQPLPMAFPGTAKGYGKGKQRQQEGRDGSPGAMSTMSEYSAYSQPVQQQSPWPGTAMPQHLQSQAALASQHPGAQPTMIPVISLGNMQALEQLTVDNARLTIALEQRLREAEATLYRKVEVDVNSQYVIAPQTAKQSHSALAQQARQSNWGSPQGVGPPHLWAWEAILRTAYHDEARRPEWTTWIHERLTTAAGDPNQLANDCLHCRVAIHRDAKKATVSLKLDPQAANGQGLMLEAEIIRLLQRWGRPLTGTAPMGAGARRVRQGMGANWRTLGT